MAFAFPQIVLYSCISTYELLLVIFERKCSDVHFPLVSSVPISATVKYYAYYFNAYIDDF